MLKIESEEDDAGAGPAEDEPEEPPPLTGDPDVAPGAPFVGAVEEPADCEEVPTGCASDDELAGFGAPVVSLDEVGGRSPLETDDRDEVPVAPERLLVEEGEGGRIGLGTDEDDEPAGPEVAVTVTGQTVVERGTVIVLTGQSLMPGPQL